VGIAWPRSKHGTDQPGGELSKDAHRQNFKLYHNRTFRVFDGGRNQGWRLAARFNEYFQRGPFLRAPGVEGFGPDACSNRDGYRVATRS
jgi:hypothetical protein